MSVQVYLLIGALNCLLSNIFVIASVGPHDNQPLGDLGIYKFHADVVPSWERAREVCEGEGSNLAVIDSEAEAEYLRELFARHPDTPGADFPDVAYIGFHDLVREGVYVTIFDKTLNETGFSQWSLGEPNNYFGSPTNPGEDCGALSRNGTLNDMLCFSSQPFFCERLRSES